MGAANSYTALCKPKKVKAVICKCKSTASSCPCGSSNDNGRLEMHVDSVMAGMDYSFLGSAWEEAAEVPKRLFHPGGLVVFHGMESGGKEETGLAKAYELRPRPLGWGTFGEVVAARHRKTGANRAVKSVSKARLGPQVENARDYVRQEAGVLRQLDHPNIVRLYEVFEDHANLYLVLELCRGGNLCDRLRTDGRPLNELEGSGVLGQVLSAVRHMHARGLVHRDLKMENVLLASAPERPWVEAPLVKLTDFGLAVRQNLKGGLRLSEVAGTLAYMAPEAVAGKVAIPFADRTDMWSLGILLHKMLTGKYPSAEEKVLLPEASAWARDLLDMLLCREPELRPTAAAAARHAFFDCLHVARQQHLMEAVPALNDALRAFAAAPRFRRLALAATARAADDATLIDIWRLFEALESECDGLVSRQALEKSLQTQCPTTGPMVQSLLRVFESVDVDGSGGVEWTELVAVVLGVAGTHPGGLEEAADGNHAAFGSENKGIDFIDLLQEDACQSAFELLSQGSGLISGLMLGQLFVQADARRWLPRMPSGHGGTGGRPLRAAAESVVDDRSLAELDLMVRDVEPTGAVKFKAFRAILGIPTAYGAFDKEQSCLPAAKTAGEDEAPCRASARAGISQAAQGLGGGASRAEGALQLEAPRANPEEQGLALN